MLLGEKAGGAHDPMLVNDAGTRILKPLDAADRRGQLFSYVIPSKTLTITRAGISVTSKVNGLRAASC